MKASQESLRLQVAPVFVRTLKVLPEACIPWQVRHSTDLIPGLVGEPAGGRVRQLVLKPNTTSEEEHELFSLQFTLGSVGGRVVGRRGWGNRRRRRGGEGREKRGEGSERRGEGRGGEGRGWEKEGRRERK